MPFDVLFQENNIHYYSLKINFPVSIIIIIVIANVITIATVTVMAMVVVVIIIIIIIIIPWKVFWFELPTPKVKSVHKPIVANQFGAFPGFYSMKQLGVFLIPPRWDSSLLQCYSPATQHKTAQPSPAQHSNFLEVIIVV